MNKKPLTIDEMADRVAANGTAPAEAHDWRAEIAAILSREARGLTSRQRIRLVEDVIELAEQTARVQIQPYLEQRMLPNGQPLSIPNWKVLLQPEPETRQ